jgi:hypothetical protein
VQSGAALWQAALFIFASTSEKSPADLAEGLVGAKIERHQHLNGDSAAAVVEFVNTNDLAQRFLIDRAGSFRVGIGYEDPQAFFVFLVFGDEVDAVLRGVLGGKNLVEIGEAGFGRAHANDARKPEAAFAATFFCSQARHDSL